MLELGKADANLRPQGGHSALHVALRLCHFMMCVLLLMAGADPNAVGEGSEQHESNLMVCRAAVFDVLYTYLMLTGPSQMLSTVCFLLRWPTHTGIWYPSYWPQVRSLPITPWTSATSQANAMVVCRLRQQQPSPDHRRHCLLRGPPQASCRSCWICSCGPHSFRFSPPPPSCACGVFAKRYGMHRSRSSSSPLAGPSIE